tara:strand:- start:8538 stop:9713 length:1176 start_codon:yes stop_codon:yes gene_type:complete
LRKIIFDIEITGHHTEYLNHLIDYIHEFEDEHYYFFVVHPNFIKNCPEISSKAIKTENITLSPISVEEFNYSKNNSIIKKSIFNYKLLCKYVKYHHVKEVILLYFNVFQLVFIFSRPSFSIRGILFLQFTRMERNILKEKLKYWRKYYTTKLYTLNPSINDIFILNDNKTAVLLNKSFDTQIFKMLPDPIPNLKPLQGFNIYTHYNINQNQKIFLHIGSLGDRKGTFEVVESSIHLPIDKQKEITILLVGKINDIEQENNLQNKIKEYQGKSFATIIWCNQFVPSSLMKSLFEQCFAVLMPYKNNEASSGILGHAAAANKKVIATGKGLLKELINEYELGTLINNTTPDEIANKMVELVLSKNINEIKKSDFLSLRKPTIFAKTILHHKKL